MLPLHHDPNVWSGVCVSIALYRSSPCHSVVRGGLEPTTGDSSDRCASFTPPDHRSVGMAGLEPASPCSQSTWVRRYPTSRLPVRTAGFEPTISCTPSRRDSQASLRSVLSDPYGSRTHLPGLKGRCPRTDRRTSRCRRAPSTQLEHGLARRFHAAGRAVLESASAAFQAAATPSQLPTQTKKPDVLVTPGFRYSLRIGTAKCHKRIG